MKFKQKRILVLDLRISVWIYANKMESNYSIFKLYMFNYSDPRFLLFIKATFLYNHYIIRLFIGYYLSTVDRGRRGRDHTVVRFAVSYAISAYHH